MSSVASPRLMAELEALLRDLRAKDDEFVRAGVLPPREPGPKLTLIKGGRDA